MNDMLVYDWIAENARRFPDNGGSPQSVEAGFEAGIPDRSPRR